MKHLLSLTVLISATLVSGTVWSVEWEQDDIDDLVEDVKDVKERVESSLNANVRVVANKLNAQRVEIVAKGDMVIDVVSDVLGWTQELQVEYLTFTGKNQPTTAQYCTNEYGIQIPCNSETRTCTDNSLCYEMRQALRVLVDDIEEIKDMAPGLLAYGSDDPEVVKAALSRTPAIVLFSLRNRWDQLGDTLSVFKRYVEEGISIAGPEAQMLQEYRRMLGNQNATRRFCTRNEDESLDQIRVNRILALLEITEKILDEVEDVVPDDINVTLLGEGTAIPAAVITLPLNNANVIVKAVSVAITLRNDNLNVCAENLSAG